jgi:hypothetical protein
MPAARARQSIVGSHLSLPANGTVDCERDNSDHGEDARHVSPSAFDGRFFDDQYGDTHDRKPYKKPMVSALQYPPNVPVNGARERFIPDIWLFILRVISAHERIRLSRQSDLQWWAQQDSNLRPAD